MSFICANYYTDNLILQYSKLSLKSMSMYEIFASEPNEKTTLELECLHHETPSKELLKEKPFPKPTFQCRGQ
jgi:hypothetical protein